MRAIPVLALVASCLLLPIGHASSGAAFKLADDFAAYKAGSDGAPAWETSGILWEVAEGKYVAADAGRSFAVAAKAPYAKRVVVEATATVRKAVGREWKIAGVAVVLDERNYWHFAFVEAPDDETHKKRHFVELSEMLDGVWLSHSNAETKLTVVEAMGDALDWQYGRPYRIRIELTETEISGSLSEMDGKVLARKRYKLDNRAVTFGRPALACGGLTVAFDDVAVRCDATVPAPEEEKPTFPEYTQAGRIPLPEEPGGKATGFFHVEQHDGRWWTIDPKGRPFFIVGTDHANFRAHWCEKLGYAPYHRNMVAQFGAEAKWAASTAERLLSWGFNCVAAGHSPSLRYRGLAWMGFISFGSTFSDVSDICPKEHWTGFPNVFHPKWPLYCDKRAKQVCAQVKDDPWLVGWFLDNELEWYGKEHREWSLTDEILKKPADHSGKQALVSWLRRRYPTVEALNAAWGTKAASYEAIAASAEPLRHTTEQGRADKVAFLAVIAERYFGVAAAAVRKHDPNHMILGSRFAGGFPEGVGRVAGRHCDIFTINCYRTIDLETEVVHGFADDLARWHAEVQRPFTITEWSFPALDSGLPCKHGAGMRVDTQAQKARCFTIFQRLLFATPFLVGSNYFMWVDEPALGISSTFPEDSNYGLVDVHNKPYKALTDAATRLNPQVYAYHAGLTVALRVEFKDKPLRAIVTNDGGAPAGTELDIAVRGKRARRPIEVRAGRSVEVPIGDAKRPALGFVRCVADPDATLAEVNRRDNVAWRVARPDIRVPAHYTDPKPTWAVVELVNPTEDTVEGAIVEIPLRDFAARTKPAATARSAVAEQVFPPGYGVEAWRWPAQIDVLGDFSQLVLLAPKLQPLTGDSVTLRFSAKEPTPPKQGWPVQFRREGEGCTVDNGVLKLVKAQPGADAFDRIEFRGREVGRFVPVIWQDVGQNLWPKPETAKIVGVSNGPVRLAMDIEFELKRASAQKVLTTVDKAGKLAEQARQPGAFKTCYRFYVYPGKPWFGARFLWLENTDVRPWKLMAYFHYALSSLAGDASDDEVGGPDVPNYYRRGMAVTWFDPKAKLHYGIAQSKPGDFQMHFWKDPAGGQHADVRREIGVTLKPGERYDEPQPTAYVFGAEGERGSKAWMPIVEEIRRWAAVEVKLLPVEK